MIYGIKTVVKYVLGIDLAGRNFAVYPDDTFVVSYPRSGNTWTRFLIANLVHADQDVSFANIKTHEYFDHRYPKIIYIVRDPRDVVLSYYDFQRKYMQIDDQYPLERYVDDFVNGKLISIGWGTWGENVASWMCTRGKQNNFLLLRYEDMMRDTARELERMARFMGIDPTANRLQRAIDRSSAERMRALEKLEEDKWVATKNRRKDIPFVRVAKSGGWRTALPEGCVRQIETAWSDLMKTLGYEGATARLPEPVR
jgi:hypothetical protein